MQVAQTEVLRPVDDNRIGIGDVYTALDDGGGHQHVVIIMYKTEDDILQFFRRHLPVPHANAGIRHMLVQQSLQIVKTGNTVVHDEHLPVAAHLEVDRLGYQLRTERMHLGLHGITVGRRGLYDRQIACPHQGELQRTRNRRGGKRQRVHVDLHLPQLFFGSHPELLLFVDNQQAEVLKLHRLAYQFVRPHNDIDLPVGQIPQYFFGLGCATGTAQVIHPNGHPFQTRRKSLEMLIGQHGGRHQHRHLLIVRTSLEGSADGHLGLAESHIPTYQTVHRTVALHVGLHGLRGLQLVGRVLVEEACLEFVLHETVGTEGETFLLTAQGIQLDEVACDILDFGLRPLFQAFPCPRAQLVQPGRLALLATVFAHLVQGVNGDEHHIVVLIDNLDDFLHGVAIGNAHQTAKLSDPVVYVNHVIADVELLKLFQRKSHFAAPRLVAAEVILMETVENLMVGEKACLEVIIGKPGMQSTIHGSKTDTRSLFRENGSQPVGLFGRIGQYI